MNGNGFFNGNGNDGFVSEEGALPIVFDDLFTDYGTNVAAAGGSDVPIADVLREPSLFAPRISTADILRDPANPIYDTPPFVESGQATDGGGFDFSQLFKSILQPVVQIGAAVGSRVLTDATANIARPSLVGRPAQAPSDQSRLPTRAFPLPSFLGGGRMTGSPGTGMILLILAVTAWLVFMLLRRR